MQALELIETAFARVSIVTSREVSALLRLARMPELRTYALTRTMRDAGFFNVDRPQRRDAPMRSSPVRIWHIPGEGQSIIYGRHDVTPAVVREWIKLRTTSRPDGRRTRWENCPGAGPKTARRAALAEALYHAKKQGLTTDVTGFVDVLCEVCHTHVIMAGRRQCKGCDVKAKRLRDHLAKHKGAA